MEKCDSKQLFDGSGGIALPEKWLGLLGLAGMA